MSGRFWTEVREMLMRSLTPGILGIRDEQKKKTKAKLFRERLWRLFQVQPAAVVTGRRGCVKRGWESLAARPPCRSPGVGGREGGGGWGASFCPVHLLLTARC